MDENNNQVNYGPDPVNPGPNPEPNPNPNQQPPVYDVPQGNAAQNAGASNGMAIGSLVCGIISIICSCWCCGVNAVLAIVALVLGIIGRKKAADNSGRGMALGGIICGAIGLVISIVYIIMSIISLIAQQNATPTTYYYY